MKTLLVATHNKAKLKEIKETFINKCKERFQTVPYKILSLSDLEITTQPEETGKTFQENACLKAKYYAQISKLPTITDDGGLIIDILGGEPGVKSNRWIGREATDQELIDFTLKKLEGIPPEKRTAHLVVVLCFYDPSTQKLLTQYGEIRGHIADKPNDKWTTGYPYRGLFIVDKFKKYYDDLTENEHDQVNHRILTLKKLLPKLEKYLLK